MRAAIAIVVGLSVVTTACGAAGGPANRPSQAHGNSRVPAAAVASRAQPCPSPTRLGPEGGTATIIDYVDFVQWDGKQYLSMFAHPTRVNTAELGERVGTVRCRISDSGAGLHYRFRDGDSAFLAPGTQLFAVRGWPVRCRIAAAPAQEQPRVFVAERPGGRTAQPVNCPRQP